MTKETLTKGDVRVTVAVNENVDVSEGDGWSMIVDPPLFV